MMTKDSFQQELNRFAGSNLKVVFNTATNRWNVVMPVKRPVTLSLGKGQSLTYYNEIDDLVMVVQDTMHNVKGSNRFEFRGLDMRAIWALAAGDTRRHDFLDIQKKFDRDLLFDRNGVVREDRI